MRVLVLGATGMLGYSIFSNLSEDAKLDVFGIVRSIEKSGQFFKGLESRLKYVSDIKNTSQLKSVIMEVNPAVVINCVGLIKQQDVSKQHIEAIEINALLPHQIAKVCDEQGSKLIHFSTDCVFAGDKGLYKEDDVTDAPDLYGQSKRLGEVDYGKHLTLRTSIIGHELNSNISLIDWFLSQDTQQVKGFTKAIFSGLPTCVIAKLLSENILKSELSGLYHLSVQPIDKYSLLKMVAEIYGKQISIDPNDDLHIDRSLDSTRLQATLNLTQPSWIELVQAMHDDYKKRYVK